jgi:hypothetical protein
MCIHAPLNQNPSKKSTNKRVAKNATTTRLTAKQLTRQGNATVRRPSTERPDDIFRWPGKTPVSAQADFVPSSGYAPSV